MCKQGPKIQSSCVGRCQAQTAYAPHGTRLGGLGVIGYSVVIRRKEKNNNYNATTLDWELHKKSLFYSVFCENPE